MALYLHPLVILLITFRSIPEGIARAPYTAGLNKFLKTKHRATFFSMNSLAGRLSFSLLLLFLSFFSEGNNQAEWPTISNMLLISAGFALISFLILWTTKKVFSNDNVQA